MQNDLLSTVAKEGASRECQILHQNYSYIWKEAKE